MLYSLLIKIPLSTLMVTLLSMRRFVRSDCDTVTVLCVFQILVIRVIIVPMSLNRLVSLNGKHNFNRKQMRLYTEL